MFRFWLKLKLTLIDLIIMRSLILIAFCAFSTLIAVSTDQRANATVNEQQERVADLICDYNPDRCQTP